MNGTALPILYRDDWLVVVDKPAGLLVHRSPVDARETRFAVQMLRDQLGRHVYRLRPQTGRRHQLRRHLAHLSHPIVGDSTMAKGRTTASSRTSTACGG
jgi:23S rRNA-/tRNA-specific pseudouridylate synthase